MRSRFLLKVYLQVGEDGQQSLSKFFFRKGVLKVVRPPIIELYCGVEERLELEGGQFKSLLMDEFHAISILLNIKLPL